MYLNLCYLNRELREWVNRRPFLYLSQIVKPNENCYLYVNHLNKIYYFLSISLYYTNKKSIRV